MSTLAVETLALKAEKNELVSSFVQRSTRKALTQTFTTIAPYMLLLYAAIESLSVSYWLSAFFTALLTLFVLRVFVMLHDCGHNCLYPTPEANARAGFIFGVMCGVPQYVWSKHHDYHHSTNGNWNKYRGPLSVLSVEEYSELSDKQKCSYARQRKLFMGPLAGFLYFIFNPRFTWIKGTLGLVAHLVKGKLADRSQSYSDIASTYETHYWATWREYRHMSANNVVLLSLWVLAASFFGAAEFFSVYVIALSLAGAIGIILFTVQHNYEGVYASGDEGWDYYTAALAGTSYLKLPAFLNWFSADIAYHHIHHLSARIPNYNLKACHQQYRHLFTNVKRLSLKDIPNAFSYIIWDENNGTLITAEQYNNLYGATAQAA